MVRMTTIEPVGYTIDLVLAHNVGIVEMGIIHCYTEIEHHVYTSPVAQSDGYTIGIVLVEAFDIVGEFLNKRAKALLIGLILHRDAVEGCL